MDKIDGIPVGASTWSPCKTALALLGIGVFLGAFWVAVILLALKAWS